MRYTISFFMSAVLLNSPLKTTTCVKYICLLFPKTFDSAAKSKSSPRDLKGVPAQTVK